MRNGLIPILYKYMDIKYDNHCEIRKVSTMIYAVIHSTMTCLNAKDNIFCIILLQLLQDCQFSLAS